MGKQARVGLMGPTLEKEGKTLFLLSDQSVKTEDLLRVVDLSWAIWFSEIGGYTLWKGMEEADLLALNF